jgi:hypothetical protein
MPLSTKYFVILAACLGIPILLVAVWMRDASASLAGAGSAADNVAIAAASDDTYCTPALKAVLRRVASACGLVEGGGRGCKPTDVKTVASLSGGDFNALFQPLADRAYLIQFDSEAVDLDAAARATVEKAWGEQRGASFFFVVARASPDGDAEFNRMLSEKRANAVYEHLANTFNDSELRREVGLMWLGEEFAQLSKDFCEWQRSREGTCSTTDINRSAFVAWIDCAI